jgi:hypothetical protein
MTEVVIRNKSLLKRLNSFTDEFFSIDGYYDLNHRMVSSPDALENPEYYCSPEYLQEQIETGEAHSGYPEEYMSHTVARMVEKNPDKFTGWRDRVRNDFAAEIGAMHSALLNYYPPGGFVGWHTNWNANAYQILFTWSETGDGYFRYRDHTGTIITEKDKPGWQCRHYYFGAKHEKEHHCWHAAYAGCDRITLAYKFENDSKTSSKDAGVRMLRDQLIEEIEQGD